VKSTLQVKELSSETWPDFDALFGKHKGVRGGCWCTFHLCASSQFDKMSRDERRTFHKNLATQSRGCGVLVYDAGIPIAWCQFGPAELFPRYDRGREYSKLALGANERPQWRISCLFADKHRRREGLAKIALHAALECISRRGGGVVEAFPLDVPGTDRPQYTGSVKMYEHEGFREITRLGKNTVLMRRVVRAGKA
jgi:GNAT superfamily N-acetyltransferase